MNPEKPKLTIEDFAKLHDQFIREWQAPAPSIESLQIEINKLRNQILHLESTISLLRSRRPYNPYEPIWPMHPANPHNTPNFTC